MSKTIKVGDRVKVEYWAEVTMVSSTGQVEVLPEGDEDWESLRWEDIRHLTRG